MGKMTLAEEEKLIGNLKLLGLYAVFEHRTGILYREMKRGIISEEKFWNERKRILIELGDFEHQKAIERVEEVGLI
jgi:hypothetical protein